MNKNNPNRFYVYLHKRLTDGSVFYVGKGSNQRAWDFSESGRNPYWHNTYNKYGIEVEILYNNLSEQEAFNLEIDTIFMMKQLNQKLCNLTDGGEGQTGLEFTDAQRLRIAAGVKGKVPWNLGCKTVKEKTYQFSVEHREKLRERKIGKYLGNSNPYADLNIYHFIRLSDGIEIKCTRSDLVEIFKLNRRLIEKLFYTKPRKSADGWKLKKEI